MVSSVSGIRRYVTRISGVCHNRCWPPSSAIICPVMAGELRMNETALAISSGVVPWPRGMDRALVLEVFRALIDAGKRWAGADGVDPDARREPLRHRLCRRPQRRFAQRVGEELRVRAKDALIDDVDDVSGLARGELSGEGLGEEHRRFQVDGEMRVPALLGQ